MEGTREVQLPARSRGGVALTALALVKQITSAPSQLTGMDTLTL
jgi:hypothetical protein